MAAKSIEQLFQEADELISQKTMSKTASQAPGEDAISKLARDYLAGGSEPDEAAEASAIRSVTEKIAHAAAIVDTYYNLPLLMKEAEFIKNAKAAGHTDEAIEAILEKTASKRKFHSVLFNVPWLSSDFE